MEFPLFEKFPKLQYGLSEKKDGSMRLFNDFSKDQTILKNREIYFSQPGISLDRLVSADLVHGNNIQMVNKNQAGKIISNTDAIVTNTENLFLTITVADCFPVYFYEPVSKVVALAHIGWRGALKNIIGATVNVMVRNYIINANELLVGIGPGIQKCHFEIQKDVLSKFGNYSDSIIERNDKIFMDLPGIIFKQLKEIGIQSDNIQSGNKCTYCLKDKYFSYRRDKPKILQTMIAYIGFKNEQDYQSKNYTSGKEGKGC